MVPHKKMGLRKGCDLGKRCCFKVRMGTWVRLTREWAWGEDIPMGEGDPSENIVIH
jgi:hypothetical protein